MGLSAKLDQEQLLDLLHHVRTSTEVMERLGSGLVNHVLEVWSGTFPTTGIISREYSVAAGSIRVRNHDDATTLVVSSAGPVDSAPTGLGSARVSPGHVDTIPLASRQVTLYGASGEYVSFQVFTAAVLPTSG